MTKPKKPLPIALLSTGLFLGMAFVAGFQPSAKAQTSQVAGLPDASVLRITFDPPGPGKPKDTAGGASRDGRQCAQELAAASSCVKPLMPATQEGLTVAERPVFLAYVPQTSAKQVFFSLVDENNQNIYQTKVPITGNSGILSVQLPDTAPALEVGKNYHWTFIIVSEQGLRPDSPGVQGSIKRIEANTTLKSQLANASPLERAALYGKAGIWVDTIGTLAALRKSQPQDVTLAENWKQLLTSVGLEAIANQPLL